MNTGKRTQNLIIFFCLTGILVLLSACTSSSSKDDEKVRVIIEDNAHVSIDSQIIEVDFGSDISVTLTCDKDYSILSADYPDASFKEQKDGSTLLTLHDVRYPVVVSLNIEENPYHITYHANGGTPVSDNNTDVTKAYSSKKLRPNTLLGSTLFSKEGYTLIGWNTMADGTGDYVPCGSRISMADNKTLDLYAQWALWSDQSLFLYETNNDTVTITGYSGNEAFLVIPSSIDNKSVRSIAESAFAECSAKSIVLPPTLNEVDLYAFSGSDVESLYIYDSTTDITDYSFSDCENLHTVYINAARLPSYSGSYYDTFPDKYDRLRSISDRKKIVLFSGSSARFGYDSESIDNAFADYDVEDMGVFAYTNALPQLDLIMLQMKEGDILLNSPEFDAAKRQFCSTNAFDDKFFCLIESDYALLSLLDYQDYSSVFSSFSTFLKTRNGMDEKSYDISPSDFDEDENPVGQPSYNLYGDYIVERPNADDDTPIYDLPVDYTTGSYDKSHYIDPLNSVYDRFSAKGISCLFTYAPRNREALSKESTDEAIIELDNYFKQELHATVISDPFDSLFAGRYLYGTDNHLSSEGVEIRTRRIIEDLNRYFDSADKEVSEP